MIRTVINRPTATHGEAARYLFAIELRKLMRKRIIGNLGTVLWIARTHATLWTARADQA
jgi:hypothetical protein